MWVRHASNNGRPLIQCSAYVETISSQTSSDFGSLAAKLAYSIASSAEK